MRDSDNWASTVGAFQEVYKAATAAPVVTPQAEVSYRVQPGDTVSAIAKANGMTTKELLAINPALTSNPKYNGGNTIFSNTKIILEPAVKAPKTTTSFDPLSGTTVTPPTEDKPVEDKPVEDKPVEDKPVEDKPVEDKPPAGGSSGNAPIVNPVTAATSAVTDQVSALQAEIAALTAAFNKPKAATVVGQKTVRKTGGVVEVYQTMSDGTTGALVESYKDYGARDSVLKMFENTGLGAAFTDSLVAAIDKVYEENIMPTDAQVLNSIYDSDAYKTRFAANEAIAQRMKDGKGRPGDRLLKPYEYIQTEKAYEEIMREADLPTGFYDQQEDFTKFIENSISVAELTERVNLAQKALNQADQSIVTALQDYYNLTPSDLRAYLLDKERAFNLIDSRFKLSTEEAKRQYTTAEIGGSALRANQMSDKAFAEEIFTAGKAGQAESAFQSAATQQKSYKRLLGLYGDTAGDQDLAREELALAGGTDVTMKKKKLASKERAMFQQKSAIDTTSLARRNKTADV